ncbi:Uncharacterized protein Rs2_02551 [Raphanus sativus]|nr:Uncharacterized protein Rs2_02551 [Raphanus sativus]
MADMVGSSGDGDGTTPMKLHELSFLRDEWERLAKNAEDTASQFAMVERRLEAADARSEARFAQITKMLERMELARGGEKPNGKGLASPSDSMSPMGFPPMRSTFDHVPSGMGLPPSVLGSLRQCRTVRGVLLARLPSVQCSLTLAR